MAVVKVDLNATYKKVLISEIGFAIVSAYIKQRPENRESFAIRLDDFLRDNDKNFDRDNITEINLHFKSGLRAAFYMSTDGKNNFLSFLMEFPGGHKISDEFFTIHLDLFPETHKVKLLETLKQGGKIGDIIDVDIEEINEKVFNSFIPINDRSMKKAAEMGYKIDAFATLVFNPGYRDIAELLDDVGIPYNEYQGREEA